MGGGVGWEGGSGELGRREKENESQRSAFSATRFDPEDDARRFHVSPEGVVLVTVAMLEALRLGQA